MMRGDTRNAIVIPNYTFRDNLRSIFDSFFSRFDVSMFCAFHTSALSPARITFPGQEFDEKRIFLHTSVCLHCRRSTKVFKASRPADSRKIYDRVGHLKIRHQRARLRRDKRKLLFEANGQAKRFREKKKYQISIVRSEKFVTSDSLSKRKRILSQD